MLDHSHIKARPNAAKRHVSYLQNWLFNNNGPIRPAEASFAEQDDLMPVISREKPPLRKLIDRYDILSRFSWWRIRKENVRLALEEVVWEGLISEIVEPAAL